LELVAIGFSASGYPTHTATVRRSVNPTNQASPEFSVVPVLPAANSPRAARLPVPWATTVDMTCVAVRAVTGLRTGIRRVSLTPFLIGSSSLSRTREMPTGPLSSAARVPVTRCPPAWKVSNAWAMSSGVTPCSSPPSVIARFEETGVRMPILRASRATFFVPTSMPAAAYTELSEYVSALASVRCPV